MRRPSYTITLVALNATLGTIRLLESPNRTTSPAYHYAKQVMPMRWWGVLFLAGAVVMLVARHKGQVAAMFAACVGCGLWTFWAVMLGAAAFYDGRSSYAGVVVYAAGAVRHFQVARGG